MYHSYVLKTLNSSHGPVKTLRAIVGTNMNLLNLIMHAYSFGIYTVVVLEKKIFNEFS